MCAKIQTGNVTALPSSRKADGKRLVLKSINVCKNNKQTNITMNWVKAYWIVYPGFFFKEIKGCIDNGFSNRVTIMRTAVEYAAHSPDLSPELISFRDI